MKLAYKILLPTLILFIISCGDNASNVNENNTEQEVVKKEIEVEKTVEKIILKNDGLTLSSLTPSSPEFPDAKLKLNTPADGSNLEEGMVNFDFEVKNYELMTQTSDVANKHCANSGKGQHIHLILNNAPYMAKYESKFDVPLETGAYTALAFLSRSYHESIKTTNASVVFNFTVGDVAFDSIFVTNPKTNEESLVVVAQHSNTEKGQIVQDLSNPLLFYSRPKGTYTGEDTKKLLFDFYLANTTLSEDGNKVKLTIDETVFEIPKWVPFFVEGLTYGEHTFKIELIDNEGNNINSDFNVIERTILLEEAKSAES